MNDTAKATSSAWGPRARALYLTGFASFIGLYLPQPVLPLLAGEFGVDAAGSSLIISLTILGIGVASPFIGVFSDRFGRKRILVGASFLLSLVMLGCALSAGFSALLMLRFAQGLLLPGLFVVAVAYTSDILSREAMARAAGIYVAATVLGGLAGRLLAGGLADLVGWRYGFGLSALFYLLLVPVWVRQQGGAEESSNRTLNDAFKGTLRHFRNRPLVGGLLVGFCLFFAFQATFNYLPFKLESAPFSLSPTLISLAYVSFVAGMVSSSLAGRFRARFDLRGSFVIGFALAILGNLLTLGLNLVVIFAGLLVVCFGNWLVQGLAVGYVATATQTDRAGANALYLLFYYVGGSLGGYLPGFIFPTFGYGGVIGSSVLALGLGVASAALLTGQNRAIQ